MMLNLGDRALDSLFKVRSVNGAQLPPFGQVLLKLRASSKHRLPACDTLHIGTGLSEVPG